MAVGDTRNSVAGMRLVVAEIVRRRARGTAAAGSRLLWPFEPTADRIVIAPPDIRTADPTVAIDIHAGRFVFSGQMAECHGASPFEIEPPSVEWARALHGFGWLRHLKAAETAAARENGQALVAGWLRYGLRRPEAWEPEVASRRLLAFLAQAPMLLDGCDAGFYRRFLQSITLHFRRLRNGFDAMPPGLGRLKAAIALVAAAVAVESFRRAVRSLGKRLDDELARQVFADGGHVSRNPAAILEILADLLPMRQAQAACGIPVSQGVMNAVDRMMHLLRFFRHGDGTLALFNGAGSTASSLVATVLVHDDARGKPPGNAPHSGYQRLEAGRTVAIMDCGTPPPPLFSREAHAGTLAFELSSGRNRLIVNCGAPVRASDPWHEIARATAAHSTLIIGGRSSAVIATGYVARTLGPVIVAGPRVVTLDRQEHDGATAVIASHDGYRALGLVHERTLRLSAQGDRFDGRDRLVASGSRVARSAPFAVRFHVHPAIRLSALGEALIMLMAPDGETWEFHADGAAARVEDSVYLAELHGARHSSQIVLEGRGPSELRWTLLRAAEARGARRRI